MPDYDGVDGDKRWATPPATAPAGVGARDKVRPASAENRRSRSAQSLLTRKRRLKRQFIFDHLWGIPGGWSKQDLALLRNIHLHQTLHHQDPTPYVVLDERDVAENRDRCCNHAFGRAAREYAWHASAHGYKFTVFDSARAAVAERVAWGAIAFLALVLGVVFSVLLVCAYFQDPVFIAVKKVGLSPHEFPAPPLTVCPGRDAAEVSEAARARVEAVLPPMEHLWPAWEKAVSGEFDPDEEEPAPPPWDADASSSEAVRQLMEQVMIEGGLMAAAPCESVVTGCNFGADCCASAQVVMTPDGPCYRIEASSSPSKGIQGKNLGHYLERARRDLNASVVLTGTSSGRLGYPVVSASHFGQVAGHLCPSAFGDAEASAVCRSLGYWDGERKRMGGLPLTFPPSNLLGSKLECAGDEDDVLDCRADYSDVTGANLAECRGDGGEEEFVGIICDQISLQLGSNLGTKTLGVPFIRLPADQGGEESYFCLDGMTDDEAAAICSMLSWPQGKLVVLAEASTEGYGPQRTKISGLSCSADDQHVLDCDYEVKGDSCPGGPAAVQCGPGFPLLLRMFDPLDDRIAPEADGGGGTLSVGYPVVDTDEFSGHFCDRGVDGDFADEAVQVMCRTLGFDYGRRLPPGILGKPLQGEVTHFVMDKVKCDGSEEKVFECGLGGWGEYKCTDQQILSLACGSSESILDFERVLLDPEDYFEEGEAAGLAAVRTGVGVVPVCQAAEEEDTFSDREADAFCVELGHDCGMLDRSWVDQEAEDVEETSKLSLLHDNLVFGLFASFNCDDGDAAGEVDERCSTVLSKSCSSVEGAPVVCVNQDSPDLELCKLLRRPGEDASEMDEIAITVEAGQEDDQQSCLADGGGHSKKAATVAVGDPKLGAVGSLVRITPGAETSVMVRSRLVESTRRAVEDWDPEDRGCLDPDEDVTSDYSQRSCAEGCRAALARGACGCVPWHLSRAQQEEGEGGVPICAGAQVVCLKKLEPAMSAAPANFTLAAKLSREADLRVRGEDEVRGRCRCLPACSADATLALEATVVSSCPSAGSSATVRVSLDRSASTLYSRRVSWPWELLLGGVGGVMALMAGYSVICVLEVLYFLCVRWYRQANDPVLNRPGEDKEEEEDADPDANALYRTSSDTDLMASAHTVRFDSPVLLKHDNEKGVTNGVRSRPASTRRGVSAGAPPSGKSRHASAASVQQRAQQRPQTRPPSSASVKSVPSGGAGGSRVSVRPSATSRRGGTGGGGGGGVAPVEVVDLDH